MFEILYHDRQGPGAYEDPPLIAVRDAVPADVPALTATKGEGSRAIHRDRLREPWGPGLRYLDLVADRGLIEFADMVTRRRASWSDADDARQVPRVVDVRVGSRGADEAAVALRW